MKVKLKRHELGLMIFALRPYAFKDESESLKKSADDLQKKLTYIMVHTERTDEKALA